MIERLHILFFALLIGLVTSCNPTQKETNIYFGGRILNPKSDHIILFYQEKAIDTFNLDQNNSFMKEIEIPHEGLYYFKHGREHQYVYLEPKDSLLIRLNAINFDETLVFSGKGAERNNMLIDCFIDAERDERRFYKLYQLEPKVFKSKVGRIEKLKMERFEQFLARNNKETEAYKKILKMALTYPLYSKIERYPLVKREQTHTLRLSELDSTFYKHRSQIALNHDSIMFFYAYRDFVMNHLYNSVFSEGLDINSDQFTIGLLNKIDNTIEYQKTKNTLFRQIAIGHFYRKSSCDVNMNTFDHFFEKSTSEEDKHLVNQLLDDVKGIHKNKKLNSFDIVDYNHSKHNIKSLIKGKNAVIYFWNSEYMSKEYVASKVNYFRKKYPEINFIGVNINEGKNERIQRLDIKSQFYLDEKSTAHNFLTSKMPRTLLVNKKGIVVNGYASLSSQNIYQQIGELAQY